MGKSIRLPDDDPTIWKVSVRKSKYRYLLTDDKHPYEWKPCLGCGEDAWIQARRDFCSYKCSKTGPLNPQWKGDDASYLAFHNRVYRERGKAFGCSVCGNDSSTTKYEWANLTGHYEDIADYASMCNACHTAYDKSRKPSNGRTVYTDEILDRAEILRQTMTLKAVAEELDLDASNLSMRLSQRRSTP